MARKKKPTKRHPHVTAAIANVEKLQKGHKQMVLHLEKVKKRLRAMPFAMPFSKSP